MNMLQLKTCVKVLTRVGITPFIWGQQGIGKSQSIKQVAKEQGVGFVHLHLATQEVGDVVGLLQKREDGTAYHTRPEWFPTSGKGILFLDELNRAHPDVIQACFSLITEKTIHTHKLPDGWSIIAAGNYQSNAFNVTDTSDAAWMSRFCHIDFQPSAEEFVLYAEDKGADSIASFIRTQPECLEVSHKQRLDLSMISPDRRSWMEMIAPLEKEADIEEFRYEVYAGILGQSAAAAFLAHKKAGQQKISGKEILNNYKLAKKRVMEACGKNEEGQFVDAEQGSRFDLLNGAVEEILTMFSSREFTESEMENFKSFLIDVPLELGLKIINKLGESTNKQKNQILNKQEFVEKFARAKKIKKDEVSK